MRVVRHVAAIAQHAAGVLGGNDLGEGPGFGGVLFVAAYAEGGDVGQFGSVHSDGLFAKEDTDDSLKKAPHIAGLFSLRALLLFLGGLFCGLLCWFLRHLDLLYRMTATRSTNC